MFSHVMIGADNVAESKKFYDAVLGTLGVPPATLDHVGRAVYYTPTGVLMLTKPIDGKPASGANGGTIGFQAKTTEEIDKWHAAGVAHGGSACEDPPGVRKGPNSSLYLAYLKDPAGNKLCALKAM